MLFNKITKFFITFLTSLLLSACMESNEQGVSTIGHSIFIRIANQEVEYALSGKITKKPGFISNCSVDKVTKSGIFITRGVCDDDNSFSIMGTNTSNYPPSKRLKLLPLQFNNNQIKLSPGEIKEIVGPNKNKINIELSRTGASFFIKGKRTKITPTQ